jgi:hypothetical protein
MTDDGNRIALAPYSATDLDRLTSGERATYNSILSKAGFTAQIPHSTERPAQAPPAPQALPGEYNAVTNVGISAKEATAGAEMLRKHWSGNIEDLETALTAIAAPVAEPTAAERSADNIAAAYAPGASAADYKLTFPPGMDIGEVSKQNKEITAAFHAAKVPLNNANGLKDALADSAAKVVDMNPAQRELHNREVLYHANKLIGQEGIDRAAKVARSFGPSFKKWSENGAFASVGAITMLNSTVWPWIIEPYGRKRQNETEHMARS